MPLTTLIEADTLLSHPDRERFVILDCRFDLADPAAGRSAFLEGHIPGAQYADLNVDLASAVTADSGRHPLPDPQTFARRAGAWGIGRDETTVVYDESNGSYAARAWWLLRWAGARDVAVLNGGLASWLSAGGKLEPGPGTAREPRIFPFRMQADGFVTTNEIVAAVADPARTLVDARAEARFSGRTEPIDPVAGHVPGAVNFPFTRNLGKDGRFLPAPELRRRWLELLGGRDVQGLICMCGSGVTACHNLLALETAGLPGARLYAGSWSEWIRDPRRPVAK